MASGLPVIGARAGGVTNIIEHGKTGYLCTPKDVNNFVDYTSVLLQDKDLRLSQSKQAHRYALTKSWDGVFEKLVMSYQTLLAQKAQSCSA